MDELRQHLLEGLRHDAELHEKSRFNEIGAAFDEYENLREFGPEAKPEDGLSVAIAQTFWDAWSEQVRHGFKQNFYSEIQPNMWPKMAREIADSLESNRSISNETVLKYFDKNKSDWWSTISSYLGWIVLALIILMFFVLH